MMHPHSPGGRVRRSAGEPWLRLGIGECSSLEITVVGHSEQVDRTRHSDLSASEGPSDMPKNGVFHIARVSIPGGIW